MKKILIVSAALILSFGLLVSDGSAQGMAGKRYLAVSFGDMLPGNDDLNRVDDAVVQIRIVGNFPILQNLDLFALLGYGQAKGNIGTDFMESSSTTQRAEGGIVYQFFPGQAFNPFLRGTLGYVHLKSNNSDTQLGLPGFPPGGGTTDDFAYSIGGGIEAPFAEQFSASPSLTYRMVGDVDDFIAAININGWFNKVIFSGLEFAYGLNDGDFTYLGTVGFGF